MSVIGLRYRSAVLMDTLALEARGEGVEGWTGQGGKSVGQRDSPASWLASMSGRDGCPGDRQPLWDRAQSNRALCLQVKRTTSEMNSVFSGVMDGKGSRKKGFINYHRDATT